MGPDPSLIIHISALSVACARLDGSEKAHETACGSFPGGGPGNVQNNPRVVLRGCGRRLRPFYIHTLPAHKQVATGRSTSMDLADCRLRAVREVPGGALMTPYRRGSYATTCMVAKGYRME